MNPIPYAQKKRKLRSLVKNLLTLLAEKKEQQTGQIERLLFRIKRLIKELKNVLQQTELRRILGAAVVFFGFSLSNDVSAQTFAAAVKNPFGTIELNGAVPTFADLDNDGDLDLLCGDYDGKMQYFKNTGTSTAAVFAAPVANPFGLVSTNALALPAFADLDGDGDFDLLAGEYYGKMQYYKNTGTKSSPAFAAPIANPFGLVSTVDYARTAFADLDGDGDLDLLVGEGTGKMIYFKNTGTATAPAFAAPTANPFSLTSTEYYACPAFADLDKDGDFDILAGDLYSSDVQYYKNTGTSTSPAFAAFTTNPFGISASYVSSVPTFADIDGDGDMDLFIGDGDGDLNFFKNTSPVGDVSNSDAIEMNVYPNPVGDVLHIDAAGIVEKAEVMNATGQMIAVFEKPSGQISTRDLSPGLYSIKILLSTGNSRVMKFVKE